MSHVQHTQPDYMEYLSTDPSSFLPILHLSTFYDLNPFYVIQAFIALGCTLCILLFSFNARHNNFFSHNLARSLRQQGRQQQRPLLCTSKYKYKYTSRDTERGFLRRRCMQEEQKIWGQSAELSMSPEDIRKHLWESTDLWNTSIHAVMKCGEGPAQFRLVYMPMRNRIEVARLMLEDSHCPYELELVGFRKWNDLKLKMLLGKVPVLRNFDGRGNDLSNEIAITQFLATKLGLTGNSDEEAAVANMLYTQFFCTLRNNGLSHDGDHYSVTSLVAAKINEVDLSLRRRYQEMHRVNDWTRPERSLAALGVFEEQLVKTGTGFLVGNTITYVDLALFNILFELAEPENVPDFSTRWNFPALGNFLKRLEQRPGIHSYVRSARRIPRYERPGYVYCEGKHCSRQLEDSSR